MMNPFENPHRAAAEMAALEHKKQQVAQGFRDIAKDLKKKIDKQERDEAIVEATLDLPGMLDQIREINKALDKKGTDRFANAEILKHIISELDPNSRTNLTPKQIKQINDVKSIGEQVLKSYEGRNLTLAESLDLIGKIKILQPKLEAIKPPEEEVKQETEPESRQEQTEQQDWKDPWGREEPEPDFHDPVAMTKYVKKIFEHFSSLPISNTYPDRIHSVTKTIEDMAAEELGIDPWVLRNNPKFECIQNEGTSDYPSGLLRLMELQYAKWGSRGQENYSPYFEVSEFDSNTFKQAYAEFLDFAEQNQVPEHLQFEVEDFDPKNFEIGKKLYQVNLDFLSDEDQEKLLNSADSYYKNDALALFEQEGIDGVIAAMRHVTDEYRDNFGGFKLIKKIKGTRILDLGTIQDKDIDNENWGAKSTLSGEKKSVTFGTDDSQDYYPRAYLNIEG